ncbi:MAG: thioesterase family protein [Neisseriaceae bacterium]|nr:thioesterase family protein [Neisseriaceae bacterium]MBP6862911.1 thioesterase family protein [Neisseriaceae bacterium]
MTRVHLNLPESFLFETALTIQVSDLNYGNHLANDKILSLAHEARIRFLKHLGYTEMDVEGAGLIMADAAIQFISQGFYGDELILKIAVTDTSRAGFSLFTLIQHQHTQKELARVKTGMVFFDYNTQSVQKIPEGFTSQLSRIKESS